MDGKNLIGLAVELFFGGKLCSVVLAGVLYDLKVNATDALEGV